MNISGKTKLFAVLGHPVAHTLSPPMHNAALATMGEDALYTAFDVAPDRLLEVIHAAEAMGIRGLNLTVPLKEVAFAGLENLDASAKLSGAVNTVKFTNDGPVGYSTDGYGFEMAAEEAFGEPLAGRSIYIAGTGGAGRAVALHAARYGAASITLANRSVDKAEKVAEEIRVSSPGVPVSVTNFDDLGAVHDAEWIVNGTSLGMHEGEPPLLPLEAFRPEHRVMDLIYTKVNTPFMVPAQAVGAKAVNGLGMLLHQGVRSLEIWTEHEVPVEAMRSALEKAVYG